MTVLRFTIINSVQTQMSYHVIKDSADLAKLECNQDKNYSDLCEGLYFILKN